MLKDGIKTRTQRKHKGYTNNDENVITVGIRLRKETHSFR